MSEGRRTRSAKTKSESVVQELPVRNTRRTRKQNQEDESTENEAIKIEDIVESVDTEGENITDSIEIFQSIVDKDKSSTFNFDENFENPSNAKEEDNNQSDELSEQELFLIDLTDGNVDQVPTDIDGNITIEHKTLNENLVQAEDEQMDEEPFTDDTNAQYEILKQNDDQATDLDAENISEDELPVPTKPNVQDAEEVSDEELPGPKMAELPADTEIVSEEELPTTITTLNNSKKEGKRKLEDYDPSDPTEENDSPEKKIKKDDEKSTVKKYKLPDLDKYWKSVKADSEDFNAWTYLLQYVDSENDVEAARDAYDSFLSRYCYCYGYWRKYADYEKKKGCLEKCNEVFERGLKAIPLSVDLWIHYLTHVKQISKDDRNCIRTQFERALESCGLEFRSDKLWEGYIRWEMEEKDFLKVVAIYDRLLATPTQGYKSHMDNFREFINNSPVQKLLTIEEFKKFRDEVRKDNFEKADDETPPGLDEADDHVRNDEEADAIKKIIINKRKKINKVNVEMINKRWSFEEGIKRPYFHVKQLEKIQLKNWKDYLDFEIEQKDQKRILVLFERCLIACALYEEFWIKLIRYLESIQDETDFEERTRNIFERACCIHHQDKPNLHLMWSAFEETHGNVEKALNILENLENKVPNLLQIAYRRINLERRQGKFENSAKLYERYLESVKNKNLYSSLAIKYARFLNKIMHNFDKAMEVLKNALDKDSTNTRLALQIIDLALQREYVNKSEIVQCLDSFMQQDNLDVDQKLLFAQRKVEFLEDFGSNVKELQEAQIILQAFLEKSKDKKKLSEPDSSVSTKKTKDSNSSNNNAPYNSTYNYQSYSNSTYPTANQWSGNYNYDYNQWSGSYYNTSSYGNYQHGSYGNSY